ncbi:hypothetical protein PSCICN_08120 [Pseudomonas cichorii]|uniref:hypothetical protein n=1 Tax=Pseudomonas cichorii TaxID=36746 RepID=UPI001910A852|nr:hypothetical protein [Pseudomonas cichorii]GFM80120.1 hypothetical protein PSCICN_08120 [Pseudomonas cichorii]
MPIKFQYLISKNMYLPSSTGSLFSFLRAGVSVTLNSLSEDKKTNARQYEQTLHQEIERLRTLNANGRIDRSKLFQAFFLHHSSRVSNGVHSLQQLKERLEQCMATALSEVDERVRNDMSRLKANIKCLPVNGNNTQDIVLELKGEKAWTTDKELVGTIFIDSDGFVKLEHQPAEAKNAVYCRQDLGSREYVRFEKNGKVFFVRRYLVRGINQSDSENLSSADKSKQVMKAVHNQDFTSDENKHYQGQRGIQNELKTLISHTRGWRKRYISATTTNKSVFSTKGKEFRSVFGSVIIDLAFVPAKDIYDLHSPAAAGAFAIWQGDIVDLPKVIDAGKAHTKAKGSTTLDDERQLAMLDVIRTREILIKGEVPAAAILKNNKGQLIVGVPEKGYKQTVYNAKVITKWADEGIDVAALETETLSYSWHNFYYTFYRFTSIASADNAYQLANKVLSPDLAAIKLDEFEPTDKDKLLNIYSKNA